MRKRLEEGPRNATFLDMLFRSGYSSHGKNGDEKMAEICEAKYYQTILDDTKGISKRNNCLLRSSMFIKAIFVEDLLDILMQHSMMPQHRLE